MARSIGDWFADHARVLPDDSPDDEVVERQEPWDLQAAELTTTRTARRDAGKGRKAARTATSGNASGRASTTSVRRHSGSATPARATSAPVPKSLRKKITAAARLNSRADVTVLAASLTRSGIPVTPQQVAAVLGRPLPRTAALSPTADTRPVRKAVASQIRSLAHAHPHLGHRRLAALLRARGVDVSRAQVAEVLRRRWQASSRAASPSSIRKPATVIKVTAAAQTSRTVHETPLCPSCGVRLSIIGQCRCS